jgi:hypothetical protein
VAPIVNPLNAACHDGFVPTDIYVLSNPGIDDVTERAASMMKTVVTANDGPEPIVEPVDRGKTVQAQLPFTVEPPDGPRNLTPHDLINETVFEDTADGRAVDDGGGTGFGTRVHEFAEAYAVGNDVAPSNEHDERIKAFIDGLDGHRFVEQPARLPLDVGGDRLTVSGVVDLVHVTDDRVEVVDYKTDTTRRGQEEYRKQLSVYYHVLASTYPDRPVTANLFYTADDEVVTVDSMPIERLEALVETITAE